MKTVRASAVWLLAALLVCSADPSQSQGTTFPLGDCPACKIGEWGIGRPPQYFNTCRWAHGGVENLREGSCMFLLAKSEERGRNCVVCTSRKSPSHKARALMVICQTLRPMQRVALDILGPLPETTRGNKYVLVIGECFTKWKKHFR